jgi:hypothetical protein
MPIGKGAIVAISVLALVLVATAAPAQEMAPDIKRIEDRGQLVVAMYHRDTPPLRVSPANAFRWLRSLAFPPGTRQ